MTFQFSLQVAAFSSSLLDLNDIARDSQTVAIVGSVSVSTSATEITEATEKIPMFCLGALGVLGGEWQTEAVRVARDR